MESLRAATVVITVCFKRHRACDSSGFRPPRCQRGPRRPAPPASRAGRAIARRSVVVLDTSVNKGKKKGQSPLEDSSSLRKYKPLGPDIVLGEGQL